MNEHSYTTMFHQFVKTVTAEIGGALAAVDEQRVDALAQALLRAGRIVVHGAGRVGLACKGFAMRLGHVGLPAYAVSDATLPAIGKGDVLVVASSSGETQTVLDIARAGKRNGAMLVVISAVPESSIAREADLFIHFNTPTKFGPTSGAESVQPMATLFEQSLQILFDIIVLILMRDTNQRHNDLWKRHSNLD